MINKKTAIKILKSGGIGVMPTDTLFGLLGLALNKKAVERIYKVRQRRPDKPLIILIGSINNLKLFGIKLNSEETKLISKNWPGAVSIVLSCKNIKLKYLHRGTNSLAFRLPGKKSIREFLKQTGPLVAPSANPEGEKPADNLPEAAGYFGNQVDFYYGRGDLTGQPSTLVKLENNELVVLRQGAVKIKN
jgi:L-threonylcarbamoyladenylate synthase